MIDTRDTNTNKRTTHVRALVRRHLRLAQEEEEETSGAPGGSRKDLVKVQVTELVDAGCFYVQVLSPEKDQLDVLMHRLETLNLDAAPGAFGAPHLRPLLVEMI